MSMILGNCAFPGMLRTPRNHRYLPICNTISNILQFFGSPARIRTRVPGTKTRDDGPLHYGTPLPPSHTHSLYLTGRLSVNIKPYSSCRELCEADLYCYRWFCYWPLHCLLWPMGQLQTTITISQKSQKTSIKYREPIIHG